MKLLERMADGMLSVVVPKKAAAAAECYIAYPCYQCAGPTYMRSKVQCCTYWSPQCRTISTGKCGSC
ncbi:hypothetical protein [Actinocorallia longicatena]|uniref:Uncharacterized protein n=1 Tax=Actinocorallia longicatena TaxID=111803 RepID=A0ABP6Q982_9ACTN